MARNRKNRNTESSQTRRSARFLSPTNSVTNNTNNELNSVTNSVPNVIESVVQDSATVEELTTDSSTESDTQNTESLNSRTKSTHLSKIKPQIQIFKVLNDKVTIYNWLKGFEILSTFCKCYENEKSGMLGNYLQDDALNCYIENYSNSI